VVLASHVETGDNQKALRKRNRAIVRGIVFPQSRPFPPLPPFSGRLPHFTMGCPQFTTPCREFQNPCRDLRSLARNCNPSAAKLPCLAGKLRRLAAKLPPLAAKLRRLAANCTTPAAKLPGLAANFTASAPIYKKLPTSHLQQLTQKNARNARNPHRSCRTPSPIGWERDGVRGLTFNLQPSTKYSL